MAQLMTIQKWGNSQGIRLSKSILDDLNWKSNEEVSIKIELGKIIIEKAVKRKSIQELFDGYAGDYVPSEFDWEDSVGGEAW